MGKLLKYRCYWPKSWIGLVVIALLACLCHAVLTLADSVSPETPAWAAPRATAIRRVSPTDSAQHESTLFNNLDCALLTYRHSNSGQLESGCFTDTAFGLMDADSGIAIFNGTDEGLPLLAYSAHELLAPWPKALDLVALDTVSTGGSYINLYKNPLGVLHDQRNALLQLTAKSLTAPPELPLKDSLGKPLVINSQTMAFSDNGSWLVVETLGGSFVRINLATLDMTAFAPAFGSSGSPALLNSQVSVSDDGNYVAVANQASGLFQVYDLTDCGSTYPAHPASFSCPSHDYSSYIGQHINGFQTVRHLRFVNDGLLSFEARTSDPASGGVYELAPTDKITSLIDYLGLGDSYTSGEGAFDYRGGTDTADNMCHLSEHSYPLLLTHDLFSEIGGHSVACSGAVINDISSTNLNYRGPVRNIASFQELQHSQSLLLNSIMTNYLPGYVAQQRFVRQYQPAVITVSVGGDDIGFGDIVQKCVMPHISLHLSDSDCYNTYEDRLEVTQLIDRTVPRWTALDKQLAAESPGSRLYIVGYPQIVSDTGNCALNVHLSKIDLEFANELIDYLNGKIQQAAAAAGLQYVDISQALAGHKLCETASYNVAVNGLTAGTDAGILGIKIFGKESYHPNALGQALIEQAILKYTHSLTDVVSANPVSTGDPAIWQAPKTGRIVNQLIPDKNLVTVIGRGVTVQAIGVKDGLRANTVYSVRLDGPTGTVIGTVTSSGEGDVATSVSLPASTSSGGHTVDVTGDNQAGEPVDVTQPIYVPASDNDADGDGIHDVLDTCPGAVNSGKDGDQDGIDDSCDPLIGSAVPSSGSIDGSTSSSTTPVNAPLSITGSLETTASPHIGVSDDTRLRPAAKPLTGSIRSGTPASSNMPGNESINLAANVHGNSQPSAKQLRTLAWLPLMLLPVILWLLIVLVMALRYYAQKRRIQNRTKIEGFELQ